MLIYGKNPHFMEKPSHFLVKNLISQKKKNPHGKKNPNFMVKNLILQKKESRYGKKTLILW